MQDMAFGGEVEDETEGAMDSEGGVTAFLPWLLRMCCIPENRARRESMTLYMNLGPAVVKAIGGTSLASWTREQYEEAADSGDGDSNDAGLIRIPSPPRNMDDSWALGQRESVTLWFSAVCRWCGQIQSACDIILWLARSEFIDCRTLLSGKSIGATGLLEHLRLLFERFILSDRERKGLPSAGDTKASVLTVKQQRELSEAVQSALPIVFELLRTALEKGLLPQLIQAQLAGGCTGFETLFRVLLDRSVSGFS